jgi:hypothetical protein
VFFRKLVRVAEWLIGAALRRESGGGSGLHTSGKVPLEKTLMGEYGSALNDTFGVPCEAADGKFGLTSTNRSFRKHRLQR